MEWSMAHHGTLTSWRDVDEIDGSALPGDKIEFHRGAYRHVGIADGRGGVFHYSGEPKQKSGARYRYDKVKEVAGGDKVRINNTEDKQMKPMPRREIVRRAEKALGTGEGEYHLARNNCEHKATEMRYGTPVSDQVSTAEKVMFGVGIGAFVIGTVCMLFGGNKNDDDDSDDE